MALAGLSALLALPCIVAGLVLHRSRYVLFRGIVMAAGASIQVVHLTSSARPHSYLGGLVHHLPTAGEIVAVRWGAARVLGEVPRGTNIDRHDVRLAVVLIGVGVLLVACASVFHTAQRVACTGLVGSALLALVLGLLVVPTDALRVLLVPVNGERYFFVPVALLAVVGVIAVTSETLAHRLQWCSSLSAWAGHSSDTG